MNIHRYIIVSRGHIFLLEVPSKHAYADVASMLSDGLKEESMVIVLPEGSDIKVLA